MHACIAPQYKHGLPSAKPEELSELWSCGYGTTFANKTYWYLRAQMPSPYYLDKNKQAEQ